MSVLHYHAASDAYDSRITGVGNRWSACSVCDTVTINMCEGERTHGPMPVKWTAGWRLAVLLVVDEVEVLYAHQPGASLAVCMAELHALGDIPTERNVSVVLSGSSSCSRRRRRR